MIASAREYSDREIYERLEPHIAKWFRRKYGKFTPPQRYAIVEIMKRKNILICAPTGSGKTFACFLGILNYLCELSKRSEIGERVYCLYISPLKALGNDIRKNLEEPLSEISQIFREDGIDIDIRIAVRTGDTTQTERQRMLKKPPHILITTPETAAIVLNAPKFREHLRMIEYVVVDEIHELADSKRGAHLSITLERLQNFCTHDFVRIGMSATIYPLDEVAKFLVGCEYDRDVCEPRDCLIADVSFARKLDVRVISPCRFIDFSSDDVIAGDETAKDVTEKLYERVKDFVDKYRSTLVFTNTRSGAERVSYKLASMIDGECVGTHHSSLSREVRFAVEDGLKSGKMKAVVCSSSLELGIDIGALEFCILIGSPKSSTRLIQRIGRSGHQLGRTARGCIIVTDIDDLVECTVLAKRAMDRKLDRVHVVGMALDVLAQHIVGMATERKWRVEDAFRVVKRAYPYRNLTIEQFIAVLRYLSGNELENVNVYPKIWFDEEEGVFGRKKSSRAIYMSHIGTIPSESSVQVYQKSTRRWIGEIDEPFLERLERNDIFVLGGKTYRFLNADGVRAFVEQCDGQPTIPSWIGEMLPLEYDSAIDIGRFRAEIERRMDEGGKNWRKHIKEWLKREYRIDDVAASDIIAYFEYQKRFSGIIPTDKRILIEHFTDEMGRHNIIFHALFGRRTLDALSRAYAFAVSRKYRTNVSVTINDNGFILRVPHTMRSEDVKEIINMVSSSNIEELLRKSIQNTELFRRRFRHCAVRGLMVLKQYRGYDISVGKQQRSSSSILEVVSKIEGFPILEETFREILEEVFDIESAKKVLRRIEHGEISVRFVETPFPSPFAHNLVAMQASDVILMESRRELLQELHRKVLEYVMKGDAALNKIIK